MLEVTFYNEDGDPSEPVEVEFVSMFSPETYGPPALVAPTRDRTVRAAVGETVMFVPTGEGALPFSIKRLTDG